MVCNQIPPSDFRLEKPLGVLAVLNMNAMSLCSSYFHLFFILIYPSVSVSLNCSTGNVKLVGGRTDGRVEVCLGGQWGTVCDDSWTDNSARVVCKQLGLPSDCTWRFGLPLLEVYLTTGDPHLLTIDAVTVASSSAKYGSVQGPIALSRVKCAGNESSLLNCQLVSIAAASRHYCTHSNDVGVNCPGVQPYSTILCRNDFVSLLILFLCSIDEGVLHLKKI